MSNVSHATSPGKKYVGPWMDYARAEAYTGLSYSYLTKLVASRQIPFRKVGRRVLFPIPALDEWINARHAADHGD